MWLDVGRYSLFFLKELVLGIAGIFYCLERSNPLELTVIVCYFLVTAIVFMRYALGSTLEILIRRSHLAQDRISVKWRWRVTD